MSDQNMEIGISSEEEDRLLEGAEEYDLFIAEPIENLPEKTEVNEMNALKSGENTDSEPESYVDSEQISEADNGVMTGFAGETTEGPTNLSQKTKVSEMNVSKSGENTDSGPESYADSEPMSEDDNGLMTDFEGEITEGPLDLSLKTTKYVITEPQSYVDSEHSRGRQWSGDFEGETWKTGCSLKTTVDVINITDSEEEIASQETGHYLTTCRSFKCDECGERVGVTLTTVSRIWPKKKTWETEG